MNYLLMMRWVGDFVKEDEMKKLAVVFACFCLFGCRGPKGDKGDTGPTIMD